MPVPMIDQVSLLICWAQGIMAVIRRQSKQGLCLQILEHEGSTTSLPLQVAATPLQPRSCWETYALSCTVRL